MCHSTGFDSREPNSTNFDQCRGDIVETEWRLATVPVPAPRPTLAGLRHLKGTTFGFRAA